MSISAATIKQYLDYFIDAFMVEKAERYDIKGKKIHIHSSKILFL